MAPFSASTVPASVFLNPLIWFLWLLDFALWLLLPPWNLLKFILQVFKGKASYQSAQGGVRHKKGVKELLKTPYEGCDTVHDLMQKSFAAHGEYKAMGTRTFLGWHTPEGSKFPLKIFGDTTWKTYGELSDQSAAFGRGLRSLGMEPLSEEDSLACTELDSDFEVRSKLHTFRIAGTRSTHHARVLFTNISIFMHIHLAVTAGHDRQELPAHLRGD